MRSRSRPSATSPTSSRAFPTSPGPACSRPTTARTSGSPWTSSSPRSLDGLSTLILPASLGGRPADLRRPAPRSHRPARRLPAGHDSDQPAGGLRVPHRPADPHRPLGGVCRDDDPDTSVVEFESPMVYERFRTDLQDGPEADLTTLVESGAAEPARSASFPPPSAAPTSSSRTGTTRPRSSTSTPQAGRRHAAPGRPDGRHRPRPGQRQPRGVPGRPGHPARRRGRRPHRRRPRRPSRGRADSTPGTFTVDGSGLDPATYTTALTNDQARLLKALDVDPEVPTRLLGRILDTAGPVADALADLDDGIAAAGVTVPKIPLIEQTAGGLLSKACRPAGTRSTRCAPARRPSTWRPWRRACSSCWTRPRPRQPGRLRPP